MVSSDQRTALYRLHDADDRLLYVGITNQPKARMAQHAADKHWWSDVVAREIEWFPSRAEAEAAEIAAIRAEKPLHNHQHRPSELLALLPVATEEPLRPRLSRVDHDERGADQRVAADVRALIMAGDVAIGEKLPSTAEFEQQYRISNVTVQRALKKLKAEGFAVGRSGAGVYATSPTPVGFQDPLLRKSRTLTASHAPTTASVAEALGLPAGETCWREQSIIEVDSWPVELLTTYRREREATADAVTYVDRLSVRMPTSEELVALNLPNEVPVMRIFRLIQDARNAVVEVQVVIEPGYLCLRRYETPATGTAS